MVLRMLSKKLMGLRDDILAACSRFQIRYQESCIVFARGFELTVSVVGKTSYWVELVLGIEESRSKSKNRRRKVGCQFLSVAYKYSQP